jgi:hypothetical protein
MAYTNDEYETVHPERSRLPQIGNFFINFSEKRIGTYLEEYIAEMYIAAFIVLEIEKCHV